MRPARRAGAKCLASINVPLHKRMDLFGASDSAPRVEPPVWVKAQVSQSPVMMENTFAVVEGFLSCPFAST